MTETIDNLEKKITISMLHWAIDGLISHFRIETYAITSKCIYEIRN